MKIVFRNEEINAAVAPLMSGISSKTLLAATGGILIEAKMPNLCIMTTFDLEKGVRVCIEADVIEVGRAIISASKFSQIVRVMEGNDITLTVDDRMCATIVSGRASHTMTALPAEDFPEIPALTTNRGYVISQSFLRGMIAKSMYAMGVNDQRPVLNGLFFSVVGERLQTVSCDSFKMATCATDAAVACIEGGKLEDGNFILPNKSVNEIYKLLSDKDEEATAVLYMSRKHIVFSMGEITFFSKLIEGEYIDYNRIILKNHRITVRVDRDELISALEHAALITEEKIAGSVRSHVRLEFEGNMLKISATSGTGSAYDEINIEHEGDDLVIAFNNRYLIDSLRACDAGRVKISLSSPLSSINIEPDEDTTATQDLFMLLPVRMKD